MRYCNLLIVASLICVLAVSGCSITPPAPPRTVAEYEKIQQTDPNAYATHVIVQHNLQRVMDGDLKPSERVESFKVVVMLAGDDTLIRRQIATILADAATPLDVQQAVLEFLLKKDHPDLARYVVQAMPNLNRHPALRDSVLEWLTKHPTAEVQSELVKLWATEPTAEGAGETRYREVIERISGKPWEQALLDGINTPGFTGAGAAVEVLNKRLGQAGLREKILKITPVSDDLAAMQTFMVKLDYLPPGATEYAAMLQLYRNDRPMIDDAARLVSNWHQELGYKFNIRDFHLIAHLAADPLRVGMSQAQLIGAIVQSANARQHVTYKPVGTQEKDDRFWARAKELSVADLWNIYLLNELLSRPRIPLAMRTLTDRDREDRRSAFGGLVMYEAGQANAIMYQASYEGGFDDLSYIPLARGKKGLGEYIFLADQRDSICRFICHFEKADNAARVGPTADELRDAAANNYYGVVFTSISADTFDAHYFNPAGEVISLGIFTLGK